MPDGAVVTSLQSPKNSSLSSVGSILSLSSRSRGCGSSALHISLSLCLCHVFSFPQVSQDLRDLRVSHQALPTSRCHLPSLLLPAFRKCLSSHLRVSSPPCTPLEKTSSGSFTVSHKKHIRTEKYAENNLESHSGETRPNHVPILSAQSLVQDPGRGGFRHRSPAGLPEAWSLQWWGRRGECTSCEAQYLWDSFSVRVCLMIALVLTFGFERLSPCPAPTPKRN